VVKGRIKCTSPVETLAITVRLLYYEALKGEASFANAGEPRIEGLASSGVECAEGEYRGETQWFIRYPAGTIPLEDNGTDRSPTKFVKCRGYVCDRAHSDTFACPVR
jgi:hypothetical protein